MAVVDPKLVVVTGASSGIGLALVKMLLAHDYRVLALSRHFDDPIAEHENFRFESVDFSDIVALTATLTDMVDVLDEPVRALINNAGVGKMGYLEQLSYDDIRVTMDVNFVSHSIVTKAFLPHFKKQRSGNIIFTGSEAALHGSRQGSVYCASKFALRGFAQALRAECGKSGVRVSIVNPGATRTAFFDELYYQPGPAAEHALQPEDVAQAIMSVLEARADAVIDEITLSPLTHVFERKP
ncbi:MAG: SDR family oxidoreductase [Gammaproteobacteria bacterium]